MRSAVLDKCGFHRLARERLAADKTKKLAVYDNGVLLCDYDHFSGDAKLPSKASGWIEDLQNRDDGIYAKIAWTPDGEKAVTSGEYRYPSPTFKPDDIEWVDNKTVRPLRLDRVGITNDPNMKGIRPLCNRDGSPFDSEQAGNSAQTTKRKDPTMTVTAAGIAAALSFLGLDPEKHTDADVQNRINTQKGEHTTALSNRFNEGVESGKKATADLAKYASRIGDKPEALDYWTGQLLNNREATIKALEAMPEPKAVEKKPALPLHDVNRAGSPAPLDNRAEEEKAQDAKRSSAVRAADQLQATGGIKDRTQAYLEADRQIRRETAA